MSPMVWALEADWNNDGVFEADERHRFIDISIKRGRRTFLERMKPGKAVLSLENHDGRFNPWYASSPLYPNILPGRRIRLRCLYAGTWYNIFYGYLDNVRLFSKGGEEIARITLFDGMRQLRGGEISSPSQVYLAGIGSPSLKTELVS